MCIRDRTHARNTIVKIYNSDGIYGVGECCPYRSIHGETQTGTVAFAKDLAAALIGSNPREIHKHVALMDRMIVGNASVKCAFDMAPVSYTHLDVYKRQLLNIGVCAAWA